MTSTSQQTGDIKTLRNRIKGHRKLRAGDILLNEGNFREHTDEQRQALRDIYNEVGFARSLLVYEPSPGVFKLIDGECRATETPDELLDVEILDVNDEEANVLIAALDPLAAMARNNLAKHQKLIEQMQGGQQEAIKRIMDGQQTAQQQVAKAKEQAASPTRLKAIQPAPDYTWVLIGIPTVRFGEIAERVADLGTVPDMLLQQVSNNQLPDPGV